jgi:hypothetical protein
MMERRWSEAEASYHAKILDSLDPDPSAIVLDVGCDDGGWTDEVRRRGFNVRRPRGESWQHVHLLTLAGLRDIFEAHGFTVSDSCPCRVAATLAAYDPRHAHFVAVVARRSPSRQKPPVAAPALRSR